MFKSIQVLRNQSLFKKWYFFKFPTKKKFEFGENNCALQQFAEKKTKLGNHFKEKSYRNYQRFKERFNVDTDNYINNLYSFGLGTLLVAGMKYSLEYGCMGGRSDIESPKCSIWYPIIQIKKVACQLKENGLKYFYTTYQFSFKEFFSNNLTSELFSHIFPQHHPPLEELVSDDNSEEEEVETVITKWRIDGLIPKIDWKTQMEKKLSLNPINENKLKLENKVESQFEKYRVKDSDLESACEKFTYEIQFIRSKMVMKNSIHLLSKLLQEEKKIEAEKFVGKIMENKDLELNEIIWALPISQREAGFEILEKIFNHSKIIKLEDSELHENVDFHVSSSLSASFPCQHKNIT